MSVPVKNVDEDHADICGEYHNDQRLSRHDRYSLAYERSVASGKAQRTPAHRPDRRRPYTGADGADRLQQRHKAGRPSLSNALALLPDGASFSHRRAYCPGSSTTRNASKLPPPRTFFFRVNSDGTFTRTNSQKPTALVRIVAGFVASTLWRTVWRDRRIPSAWNDSSTAVFVDGTLKGLAPVLWPSMIAGLDSPLRSSQPRRLRTDAAARTARTYSYPQALGCSQPAVRGTCSEHAG